MIRQFIRRRNMSIKSLQGRAVHPVHTMNAEQRQTAADQADGLEPLARLKAAKKLHPPLPSLLLNP